MKLQQLVEEGPPYGYTPGPDVREVLAKVGSQSNNVRVSVSNKGGDCQLVTVRNAGIPNDPAALRKFRDLIQNSMTLCGRHAGAVFGYKKDVDVHDFDEKTNTFRTIKIWTG